MTKKRTLSGKLLLLFVAMLSVMVISAGPVYAYVAGFSANASLTQNLSYAITLSHNSKNLYSNSGATIDSTVNAQSNSTYLVSVIGENEIQVECTYETFNAQTYFLVETAYSTEKTCYAKVTGLEIYGKTIANANFASCFSQANSVTQNYVQGTTNAITKLTITFDNSYCSFENGDKIIFTLEISETSLV